MHVGYLGSTFRGSQLIRDMPPEASVEGTLELALLKAGIIAETNYGDLYKIKWSRTSRTDKGVHALSSVFSFRALVDEAECDRDPEGLAYAAAINEHLPEFVRVFSVQRVSKKYNCRRWCVRRTYEYYLPLHCLGITEETAAADAAAAVAAFRGALQQYVGRKPFHNYTARRAQYRETGGGKKGKKGKKAAAAAAVLEEDEPEEEQQQEQQQDAEPAAQPAPAAAAAAAADWVPGKWPQQVKFLAEPDPNDRIVTSHYRHILSFTCDEPAPLVPGGTPCLRLTVCGESFMLHQIRHMIGGAVAVSRGILPPQLLAASLAAPVRVTIPRAPPHTLLLGDAFFSDFRKIAGEEQRCLQLTGPSLMLRAGGCEARERFRLDVLYPAVNELLAHPDWSYWSESLPRYHYDDEQSQQCVQQLGAWQAEQAARREARRAEEEAAAAAAAAAAEKEEAPAAAAAAAAAAADGSEKGLFGALSVALQRLFSVRR